MECKICGEITEEVFRHEVLGKYEASYFKCNQCGFLCTEEPYWLAEAYKNSITNADTGLLDRNIKLSRQLAVILYYMFRVDGRYLDYAGGYGIFTRLMRDISFEFYHVDPFTENLFAQGQEWDESMEVDGVTCFECFEHFSDPISEIHKIAEISKTMFFTTELMPEPVPPLTWEYYGFGHGQHISFFSKKTLSYIADILDVSYSNSGILHLFTPVPVDEKVLDKWRRRTNKLPHPFARRSTFDSVARLMKTRGRA